MRQYLMGLGLNGAILHIICTLMPDKHPLLIVENSINKVVFIFLHKFLGIICFFTINIQLLLMNTI
jgi:hypothetical protein